MQSLPQTNQKVKHISSTITITNMSMSMSMSNKPHNLGAEV